MIASGRMASRRDCSSALVRIFSGCKTSRPTASASCFTGGTVSAKPRPLGRSGWQSTSSMPWPAARSASSVGTANAGVPQKTSRIRDRSPLPFAGALQFADATQDQVTLERTDAEDKQNAVQMVDFVLEGARQQLRSLALGPLAVFILRLHDHARCPPHLVANVGQTEAALFFNLFSLVQRDLRIDQDDLVFRLLLVAHVDDGEPLGNTGLRRA